MNLKITDEIAEADARAGNCLQSLTAEESSSIREQLADRFGEGERGVQFSYQTLREAEGFRSQEGWRLVPDFIGEGEILFFLNPDQCSTVWRCPSAEWLVRLLADCFGFPFYAVSLDLEALFCFDDHDCVLVAGRALDHISRYKK